MTISETKKDIGFRKATHDEKRNGETCLFCKNAIDKNIGGRIEKRCPFLGTKEGRKYQISSRDRCSKYFEWNGKKLSEVINQKEKFK